MTGLRWMLVGAELLLGAGCAGRLGVGVAVTGCAGGLAGVGLTAAFDGERSGTPETP